MITSRFVRYLFLCQLESSSSVVASRRAHTFLPSPLSLPSPDLQHLKSRLLTLSRRHQSSPLPSSSISPSPSPTSSVFPTDDERESKSLAQLTVEASRLSKLLKNEVCEKEDLRRDVETMEVGYKSLQEALDRSREEMSDLKEMNVGLQVSPPSLRLALLVAALFHSLKHSSLPRLQEEIESFSLLLVERTLSGKMAHNELLSRTYNRSSSNTSSSFLDRSNTSSPDNTSTTTSSPEGEGEEEDEWTYNRASDQNNSNGHLTSKGRRSRGSLGSVHEEDESILDPELVGLQYEVDLNDEEGE